jgi:DNA-binding transcriptional regulator GbsR (MarR family)
MKTATDQENQFIENIAMLIAQSGLPRSVGRVLGLLLICDPEQLTAEELQHTLQLSSGAVSGAVGTLTKIQLVERVTFAGKRKYYYRLHTDCWQRILRARIDQAEHGAEIAKQGLGLHPGNQRLTGMISLYKQSIAVMKTVKL